MVHLLQLQLVAGEEHGVEDEKCCLETVAEVKHCEDDVTEVQLQHQPHVTAHEMEELNRSESQFHWRIQLTQALAGPSTSSWNDTPELEAYPSRTGIRGAAINGITFSTFKRLGTGWTISSSLVSRSTTVRVVDVFSAEKVDERAG